MKRRVVVTGMGIVSSLGIGKDTFWQSLLKGVSGISRISAFDTVNHFTHVGGEVKNFDPANFMSKKKANYMGRASQFAVAAAKLALSDAAFSENAEVFKSASVCLGTTMGEIQVIEDIHHNWVKYGDEHIHKTPMHQSPAYSISANVAIELKLIGRNIMFTTACAAGNYAIGYGFDLIQNNQADYVLAGGSDAFSWIAFTGFNKVRATAPEKCQPFDMERMGMIPGEGSGMLVLETLESAQKRGARIYAEVLGYGLSCDAHHMTNPQLEGIAQCIQDALNRTDILPEQVDYISAHGTGTRLNDKIESMAINQIFKNRKVPVSSIKSMLGHTMGAASAIEAAVCSLAITNSIIPPTINFQVPDPECDIDCVPNKPRNHEVNIALSNAFAFGGNNACLVLKKFTN